jgi:hypothetical protein
VEPTGRRRSDATVPSPEGLLVARYEEVSWLRAFRSPSRFPSGDVNGRICPLQWRGRAGFAPASEHPRPRNCAG